jgi:putative endonuclease
MLRRRISKWHYVYGLLRFKDNDFYIGYTTNLGERFKRHNAKTSFSTKSRTSFAIIYTEACLSKEDTLRRKRYLKTTQGQRFLKLRIRKFLKDKEKFI